MKIEILWMILNFSSESLDRTVVEFLLQEKFELLQMLNKLLTSQHQDPQILDEILWILGNFIAECRPEITDQVLGKTDILDFMMNQINYESLTPMLLKRLPWLCKSLMCHGTLPTPEVTHVLLRTIYPVHMQYEKLRSEGSKLEVLFEVVSTLITALLGYSKSGPAVFGQIFEQILQFDLQKLIESCLATEKHKIITIGIKLYGNLFQLDDDYSIQVYQKIPEVHKLIVHNVILASDLTLPPVTDRHEELVIEAKRKNVKSSLWALSNLAAIISAIEQQEGKEDQCIIGDNTLKAVLDVIKTALEFDYKDVFIEAMYFISILAPAMTTLQMASYLLNKEVLSHLIKALMISSQPKLAMYTIETLQLFFEWDVQHQDPLNVTDSVLAYFENERGCEALVQLSNQQESYEVYSMASELLHKSYGGDEEEINYFFEQDFKRNGNNIYDDTVHNNEQPESSGLFKI